MHQTLLETAECLQWLQETEKIVEALEYRMALVTDNRIELYARNHHLCQPRVYELNPSDDPEAVRWLMVAKGERPQPKFLAHRPPVDVPPEVVETTEGLKKLAEEVGPFVTEYRFVLVYRDDVGKRLRAVSMYARVGQKQAPNTWVLNVGGRRELDTHSQGQAPHPKFLTERPATEADIVNPITVESLEGDGNR